MARVPGNRVIRLGVSLGEPQRRTIPNEYVEAEGIYVISVAARLLQMHPQTLRKYERAGLVRPSRTVGMLRLYSEEDIVRLRLIKHLVGVHDILVANGAPRYVCDAGLFHSIYGTIYFNTQSTNNREEVRQLIGTEAEELVYLFLIIAVGLGCGAGQINITIVGTLLVICLLYTSDAADE